MKMTRMKVVLQTHFEFENENDKEESDKEINLSLAQLKNHPKNVVKETRFLASYDGKAFENVYPVAKISIKESDWLMSLLFVLNMLK